MLRPQRSVNRDHPPEAVYSNAYSTVKRVKKVADQKRSPLDNIYEFKIYTL